MHVEPYLRFILEKCKCLSHRALTALSDKRRNLAKRHGLMARHVNVVKMSEHPNSAARDAAIPNNQFPALGTVCLNLSSTQSFLGSKWLFQEQGE